MLKFLIIMAVVFIVFVIIKKISNRGVAMISVSEAQEMIKDSEVTILDVRTPGEYSQGHIKNSKLIPVSELSSRISELASYKEKRILVYCHAGNRSTMASQILMKNGFTSVSNLSGGISAWTSAGYKVTQ